VSNRRFLYCRDCNAVHHVTPFDTAPAFEIDGGNIREVPQDDRRIFIERHFRHRVDELRSIDATGDEPGEIVDVMKETRFEATDGQAFFVLRSFRISIADPLTYEVLPRQLRFAEFVGTPPHSYKKGSKRDQHPRHYQRRGLPKTDAQLFLDLAFQ